MECASKQSAAADHGFWDDVEIEIINPDRPIVALFLECHLVHGIRACHRVSGKFEDTQSVFVQHHVKPWRCEVDFGLSGRATNDAE